MVKARSQKTLLKVSDKDVGPDYLNIAYAVRVYVLESFTLVK